MDAPVSQAPMGARREDQVVALILRGRTEKEIAKQLAVSRNTVHSYIKQAYKTHDLHSRRELRRFIENDTARMAELAQLADALDAMPPQEREEIRLLLILPRSIHDKLQARHADVVAMLERFAQTEALKRA